MEKKRILIVDDEPSFTRMLKLNLEETGNYEVRQENRGARGLAAAQEFNPDLVLLDVVMPDMDGGDVAALIRADPALKDVPIVFLTAMVSKKDTNDVADIVSGGFKFVAKPVSFAKLLECIEANARR